MTETVDNDAPEKEAMKNPKISELPEDSTLRYMVERDIPLTVENYVGLNWMGDYTRDSLFAEGGEYWAEVEGLIEDGLLVDTKSKRVN
jgi:hypothetical protein